MSFFQNIHTAPQCSPDIRSTAQMSDGVVITPIPLRTAYIGTFRHSTSTKTPIIRDLYTTSDTQTAETPPFPASQPKSSSWIPRYDQGGFYKQRIGY